MGLEELIDFYQAIIEIMSETQRKYSDIIDSVMKSAGYIVSEHNKNLENAEIETPEELIRNVVSENKCESAKAENLCDVMGNKTLRKLCEQLELLAELSKKENTTTEEVAVLSNAMDTIANTVLQATGFFI